jgi:hypothetical protein
MLGKPDLGCPFPGHVLAIDLAGLGLVMGWARYILDSAGRGLAMGWAELAVACYGHGVGCVLLAPGWPWVCLAIFWARDGLGSLWTGVSIAWDGNGQGRSFTGLAMCCADHGLY